MYVCICLYVYICISMWRYVFYRETVYIYICIHIHRCFRVWLDLWWCIFLCFRRRLHSFRVSYWHWHCPRDWDCPRDCPRDCTRLRLRLRLSERLSERLRLRTETGTGTETEYVICMVSMYICIVFLCTYACYQLIDLGRTQDRHLTRRVLEV